MAGLLAGLAMFASDVRADLPEQTQRDQLRVCADGNNLPFTNEAGEGFENRIAELLADDLDLPLEYVWAPQVMGFVRNTLELRLCDVMIGVAAGYGFVQNTNDYYRSIYSLVVPADSDLAVSSLDDEALKGRRVGVVSETPPLVPLRRVGARVEGYALQTDTRARTPAREAIEDVAAGRTEAAVLWGPIAGYYAARQTPPLEVVPLVDDDTDARLDYRITMGVRQGEPYWKDTLNDFIERHQDEINAILVDYGVPLLDRHGQLIDPLAASGGQDDE
ncbi:quinoprotein dehydrogenase-associated putative ABC transporter substrate-binding protein [Halomonas rhizosphaerae]|uniref:Quinoprotein dehydrogenase-associated putative ABC transporter substrate-binding protein n=1 Tax=Halomonas rhizosphaerae TaxID=3043296 RepID=A0ABT6UWB9_9GAMM|nr:quinoprotein dehydrogenase-associated putative ABC transporter substrate-binding protein [Halomonas rhizosphaerae]MDI5890263.1 quinoprotein dehydrogenase-associated putative ABC transporter substrate-binding protein [Halomonas rhizosphaerae]MDI5920783.1 quinoprotein dehydrogenase-associated putative ABC transporter substrate-binding protein [Halomonas rhizosphaerae]